MTNNILRLDDLIKISRKFGDKLSDEGAILGIHEAAIKLWQDYNPQNRNTKKLGMRISNLIIGVLITADKLGVKDLNKELGRRLNTLSNQS